MFIKWAIFLIIHIFIIILRYPLSPLAVLFFTTEDGLQLKKPFLWLTTIDNSLLGDEGHKQRISGNPEDFWNKVKWLWRNGGNALNYNLLGVDYDKWFSLSGWVIQDTKSFWQRKDGAWQFRARVPVFGRIWTPYVGWGLFGNVNERCKFTATILRFNKPS